MSRVPAAAGARNDEDGDQRMNRLSELKQGLEEAWHSVAEGWRQLRDRAAGALTHFTPGAPAAPAAQPSEAGHYPAANWALLAGDVFEDDDKVVVRLEAPGMEKGDFDLEVRSDALIVRGEKRFERETAEGRYRVRQCAYGSFHRAIALPAPVQGDKATASYRNGVLRIELPKTEQARARRIEIRTD
jgi:HSP20 family protein